MPFSEYVESLYDESDKRGSIGVCPYCEDDYYNSEGDNEDDKYLIETRVLCYVCGICFKYHHDEDYCDPVDLEPQLP